MGEGGGGYLEGWRLWSLLDPKGFRILGVLI